MNNTTKRDRNIRFHPIYPNSWVPKDIGCTLQGEIFTLDERPINDDLVSFIEVIDEETGEVTQVLLGNAALKALVDADVLHPGYFIALRFDGLSKTVKKSENYMKLYSAYIEDEVGNQVWPKSTDKVITNSEPHFEQEKRKAKVQANLASV